MDLALTTIAPTADAEGLTEGNPYSVYHNGAVSISVVIGGVHTVIYTSGGPGGFYFPRLAGTVIRATLVAGAAAAGVTII